MARPKAKLPKLKPDEIYEVVLASTATRNNKTRKNWTTKELKVKAARLKKSESFRRVRIEDGKLLAQTMSPQGCGQFTVVKMKS